MQADTLIGGQILSTVPNRFYRNHQCEGLFIMPTTHMTTREMIETGRHCLNIKSADVLAVEKFSTSFAKGSPTVTDAVRLAVEVHGIEYLVLFRHQTIDDGKLFLSQEHRREEDKAKKKAMLERRAELLDLYPHVKVGLIYARFKGIYIELSEIFPDGSELVRMTPNNRFLSDEGEVLSCEATVITCMDFRQFREVRTCVRDNFGIELFGIIGLPGSSKRFVEHGVVSWSSLEKASRKHNSRKFLIFHHGDCGAYGGIDFFNGDTIAEELMHREQMDKLSSMIQKRKPGVEVIKVYARFIEDGQRIRFVKFD